MFFLLRLHRGKNLFLLDLQFPECNDPGAYLRLQEERSLSEKEGNTKESNVES